MKKHFLPTLLSLLFIFPLYTYAEATSSLPTTGTSSSTETVVELSPEIEFTACQQEAIELRDTRIAASRLAYNIAMNNALTERKNKEKAAIALSDKETKKTALKASVDSYKTLVKNAQNELTQARKTAWQTFEEDIKSCHEVKKETAALTSGDEEEVATKNTKEDTTESTPSLKKADTTELKATKEKKEKESLFDVIKSLFN